MRLYRGHLEIVWCICIYLYIDGKGFWGEHYAKKGESNAKAAGTLG